MFDDTRPARQKWPVWVATPDTTRFICARCDSEVFKRDVAFLTRISPGAAFDPWCHDCARQLSRWALRGIDLDVADEESPSVAFVVGVDFLDSK